MVDPPCGWWSRSGFAGEEGVAVHLIRPGLLLAGRAAEGVSGRPDGHIGEAGVLEHLLPARTGQPAGNSASPQVDVPQRLGWHGPAVGDFRELEHTARAQDPADLLEHCLLVGAQVDHTVGDHRVGPAVLDRDRFGEAFTELDMSEPERLRGGPRLGQHLGRHVYPDDLSAVADLAGGDEAVEPGAGADIDNTLANLEDAERERVAHAGERFHRSVWKRVYGVGFIAEPGGERAAGVEVEGGVRVDRN